jgi:hypothetical protein
MITLVVRVVAISMMLVAVACGGKTEQTENASTASQVTESIEEIGADTAATSAPLTAEQSEQVLRALALAKAIQDDPTAAVSILADKGLTPEQWSVLLEDIARDPALAAAFEAGIR